MLGWTILFGVMSLGGLAASILSFWGQFPSSVWVKIASCLFAVLFLVSLLTRAVRGRAS